MTIGAAPALVCNLHCVLKCITDTNSVYFQPVVVGGLQSPLPLQRSLSPSPALGPTRSSPGVIDLTLDDDPPPPPVLGKRSALPVNSDETYVDDNGTVHPPPDKPPRKRTRVRATSHTAPATPKAKGKGRAVGNMPSKPKSRRSPVRKVALPPLPEPHRARLSALTTAQPQGLVSFPFSHFNSLLLMSLALLPLYSVCRPARGHLHFPSLGKTLCALR